MAVCVPRDRSGFLNKVQSAAEVVVVRLRRLATHAEPFASALGKAVSEATTPCFEHQYDTKMQMDLASLYYENKKKSTFPLQCVLHPRM